MQNFHPNWPAEWLGPSGIGTSTIYLTLAEFTELSAAIEGPILISQTGDWILTVGLSGDRSERCDTCTAGAAN